MGDSSKFILINKYRVVNYLQRADCLLELEPESLPLVGDPSGCILCDGAFVISQRLRNRALAIYQGSCLCLLWLMKKSAHSDHIGIRRPCCA